MNSKIEMSAVEVIKGNYASVGELDMYYEIHGSAGRPLVLLHGAFDVNLEHLAQMHNLIPKSQLAVFPNTDHMVMMTKPNKVLVWVKEFLDNGFETVSETK
jgi:pimeloyl-ACP methyl ester carboxylesterase